MNGKNVTAARAASGNVSQAIQKNTGRTEYATTLKALFEQRKGQLAEVLPKHLSPDRLLKIFTTSILKTPKLMQCTQESLISCLLSLAELGLEPGSALGHAYLLPFDDRRSGKTLCQLIIGYRGLMELAYRSGRIRSIDAYIIYEKDKFRELRGVKSVPEHEPAPLTMDPGKPVGVWCIARFKGGGAKAHVMRWSAVMKTRDRSKSKNNGPWVTDTEEMAKKTCVRQASKYWPMSPELAESLRAAHSVEKEDEAIDVQARAFAPPPAVHLAMPEYVAPEVEEEIDEQTGEVLEASTTAGEDSEGGEESSTDAPAESPESSSPPPEESNDPIDQLISRVRKAPDEAALAVCTEEATNIEKGHPRRNDVGAAISQRRKELRGG